MGLLRILTLVYAGVLAGALAVSLIATWLYLRRIGGALAAIREALVPVSNQTRELQSPLQALETCTGEAAASLTEARNSLQQTDERLKTLAEQRGVLATGPRKVGT